MVFVDSGVSSGGVRRPADPSGRRRAVVSTIVVNDGRELAVDLEITAGRANKARLNRSPVESAREVLGVLRAVLFAPEDLALVRGDPGERRRYLDELATIRRPRLPGCAPTTTRSCGNGPRCSKPRPGTRTARSRAAGHPGRVGRTPGGTRRATVGGACRAGQRTAPRGGEGLPVACAWVASRRHPVPLQRRGLAAGGEEDFEAALLDALVCRRDAELDRGVCLVGPHRDDLELLLGDQPAKGFASHGESWSMALALRLAAYELLRSEGSDPVLLLDDVFAELDTARSRRWPRWRALPSKCLSPPRFPTTSRMAWMPRTIAIGLSEDDDGRMSVVTP